MLVRIIKLLVHCKGGTSRIYVIRTDLSYAHVAENDARFYSNITYRLAP